jgi:hypothetical protein
VRVRWRWGAFVLLAAGCARESVEPGGPVRPRDVVRARLHLPEPWTVGKTTALGAYVEVHRPGRPGHYDLRDDHVPEGSIQVTGAVTFFAGDVPLGDAAALPFAHEC